MTEFAKHLGGSWTQAKLSAIINGKRSITEEIALDFSDAFGTTPQFWMNLQSNWSLWHATKKHKKLKPLSLRKSRTASKVKKS